MQPLTPIVPEKTYLPEGSPRNVRPLIEEEYAGLTRRILHAPAVMSGEPMSGQVRVLVADDDPLVRETFHDILADQGYEVSSVATADEALACLEVAPYDVFLCDIVMPGRTGLDLLPEMIARYPEIPVILITGNGSVDIARAALHQGASDFVAKPCNTAELPLIVERNLTRQTLQRKNTLRHKMELSVSNESVLDALLSALDTRDTETEGHSERVTAYTMQIADMMDISDEAMYHIERGALLHDIGKIGIPDRILLKPGKLTPEEWVEMKKHPLIGYRMCSRIEMLKTASQIVLHHHEAWDGSGYPDGLAGTDIPLGARIFAISDTLDAMTSDRPYRAALPFSVARAEIEKFSGIQFDPDVVKVFLSVPEELWHSIRTRTFRPASATSD